VFILATFKSLLFKGDSGGPLSVKVDNVHWTQIGIVTGGYGRGFEFSPANGISTFIIFKSKLFSLSH
jgi:hypothetical protein